MVVSGPVILAKKIRQFTNIVGNSFVGMSDEAEKIMFALLTKEHLLFRGEPGIAKSAIIREVVKNITGAKVFTKQLSKDMTPTALYGAINIKRLKDDGVESYNTEGSIVDCDFAFLDEVYDANDMTLRSILEILNERIFTKNGMPIECPLHSCFMTSNYKRDSEVMDAFGDRIMLQREVQELNPKDRLKMYKGYLSGGCKSNLSESEKVTMDEIKQASGYVLNGVVSISDDILSLYDQILSEYSKQTGQRISPRRANKILSILKASALIDGRIEVSIDDLYSIKHSVVMGDTVAQIEILDAVIKKTLKNITSLKEEHKKLEPFFEYIIPLLEKPCANDVERIEKYKNLDKEISKVDSLYGELYIDVNKKRVIEFRQEITNQLAVLHKELGL
jgi:MoxR-like ATPase